MSATHRVQVVTDSTADLPLPLVSELDIAVVPLTVHIGDRQFRDGVDLTPAQFITELKQATTLPTTSQPAVSEFGSVFERAIAADRDVLCLTLGSAFSGTYNSARLAGESLPADRVQVLDSGTVSIHLGLAVLAAARAARQGQPPSEVAAVARDTLERSYLFALLETLEYLKRGGRIGNVAAVLGSLLNIKPIITVRDGSIKPLERVRTWKKALQRIIAIANERAPLASIAVLHVDNADDANLLVETLAPLVPAGRLIVGEIGPVVATHAGPGTVGIVIEQAPQV